MTVKRVFIFLTCLAVMSLWQFNAYGQPPGDPGGNPDQVPITGIEWLLGGGLLYGIRSLLKARKKYGD